MKSVGTHVIGTLFSWNVPPSLLYLQQQAVKEDVFPDAEGWENMDPDEAAKWAVGSEFSFDAEQHSQTAAGAAADMATGILKFHLLACRGGGTH